MSAVLSSVNLVSCVETPVSIQDMETQELVLIPKAKEMIEITLQQREDRDQISFGDHVFQVVGGSSPIGITGIPKVDPEHPESCPDIVVHEVIAVTMETLKVSYPGAIYVLVTDTTSMIRDGNGRPKGVKFISEFKPREV